MKNVRHLYKLLPIHGPSYYRFKGDLRFLYSKVFFFNTIKVNTLTRITLRVISPVLWFIKSTIVILRLISKYGRRLKRTENQSLRKQLSYLFSIALVKNTHPVYYYYLKLYKREEKLGETFLVNKHFLPIYSGFLGAVESKNAIQNKIDFNNHLSFLKGSLVNNLQVLRESNFQEVLELIKSYNTDIFLKPAAGNSGRDCFLIEVLTNMELRIQSSKSTLSHVDPISQIKSVLKTNNLLVQQRLHNHNNIQNITNGFLATCRITTYIDENEDISPLFAIFLMPQGSAITSNGSKGSIISPIDLKQGKLGRAISLRRPFEHIDQHIDGKGKITDKKLPNWNKALKLCLDAHQYFMDLPFIGWDIALTTDGPKLLEGNLGWGVEAWQLTHKESFNSDFFISTLTRHVKNRLTN